MAGWFGKKEEESPGKRAVDSFEYDRKGHAPFIEKPPEGDGGYGAQGSATSTVMKLLGAGGGGPEPGVIVQRTNHYKYICVGGGTACG